MYKYARNSAEPPSATTSPPQLDIVAINAAELCPATSTHTSWAPTFAGFSSAAGSADNPTEIEPQK